MSDVENVSGDRHNKSATPGSAAPRDVVAGAVQAIGKVSPFILILAAILVACGLAASLTCFVAGLYMLSIQSAGGQYGNSSIFEPMIHGIGIYFIAKSFFVGPLLISAAANLVLNRRD